MPTDHRLIKPYFTESGIRVTNPHNEPRIKRGRSGPPTRISMPDGRNYAASFCRPQWRDIANNCWIDALSADALAALMAARQSDQRH